MQSALTNLQSPEVTESSISASLRQCDLRDSYVNSDFWTKTRDWSTEVKPPKGNSPSSVVFHKMSLNVSSSFCLMATDETTLDFRFDANYGNQYQLYQWRNLPTTRINTERNRRRSMTDTNDRKNETLLFQRLIVSPRDGSLEGDAALHTKNMCNSCGRTRAVHARDTQDDTW